jgi:beta-lactam-binding protein with PASTA domain
MPDLVGQNLQDAQDTLQNLGSYLLDQEDATGKGRPQIMDRNWQVCSQHPAAGTRVQVKDMVTLRAVKNSETCP